MLPFVSKIPIAPNLTVFLKLHNTQPLETSSHQSNLIVTPKITQKLCTDDHVLRLKKPPFILPNYVYGIRPTLTSNTDYVP